MKWFLIKWQKGHFKKVFKCEVASGSHQHQSTRKEYGIRNSISKANDEAEAKSIMIFNLLAFHCKWQSLDSGQVTKTPAHFKAEGLKWKCLRVTFHKKTPYFNFHPDIDQGLLKTVPLGNRPWIVMLIKLGKLPVNQQFKVMRFDIFS